MSDNSSDKDISKIQEESIQARAKPDSAVVGLGIYPFHFLAHAGEIVAPWWSKQRDLDLRNLWKQSDHFSGALYMLTAKLTSVPVKVVPRDASVKAYRDQAELYTQTLIENSEFGKGWITLFGKALKSLFTQDNGFFIEVIGEGKKDGPIVGPALGLAHLDPYRCNRTGDPEYPVVYYDTNGSRYALHRTRVVFGSQSPDDTAEMYDVGFCALSRAINNVQHLIDIGVYEQEELGSRPKRQMLITGGGLDPEDVATALAMADSSMDAQGLRRYSKSVLIGDRTVPDATITSLNLTGIPTGFDKQTSITLGMFAIALAFGVPPRWLWPATQSGATKADAYFQHVAGIGGGAGQILQLFTYLLGGSPEGMSHTAGKFLPPHLKLVFDFIDDEQDRQTADARKTRAEYREKDLTTGVIDIRVAREQALEAGDITRAQFDQLELKDGRLPDGNDVLALFSTATDNLLLELLDIGVPEPLAVDANDPVEVLLEISMAALNAQDIMANAPNASTKRKAEQALAALGKLKEMYTQAATQSVQEEVVAKIEAETQEEKPETEETEGEQPEAETETQPVPESQEQPETETPETELPEKTEEKQFDFSAGVGKIIRGRLARGPGGKFIAAENLEASVRQALLDRLRQRREAGGATGRVGAAELKRTANREKVAGKLGDAVPEGALDALAGLRAGEEVDPDTVDTLVNSGLAEIGDDGLPIMSSSGRGLLNAANAGDVDRARKALQPKPGKKPAKKKPAVAKKPEKIEEKPGRPTAIKPTTAQQAALRRAEENKVLRENRVKVADFVSDKINGNQIDALRNFQEARELNDQMRDFMTSLGMVEIAGDGEPVLTSSGKKFLSASDKGDKRGARSALSEASDKVRSTTAKAGLKREKAEKKRADAEELSTRIDERSEKVDDLEAQADAETDPAKAEKLRQQAQREREQIAKLEERIAKLNADADQLEEDADTLDISIGKKKLETKSVNAYRHGIRAAVRGLWNGQFDREQFADAMFAAIDLNIRVAWNQGLQECGILPDEMSIGERIKLAELIGREAKWIDGYADAIEAGSKANRGKLTPLFARAEIWIGRWEGVKANARAMACADKKLKWILGAAEEHCSSCSRLAGKVKRASWWNDNGILPRIHDAWFLACRGFMCRCELVPTDEPMSKGPMPSLP